MSLLIEIIVVNLCQLTNQLIVLAPNLCYWLVIVIDYDDKTQNNTISFVFSSK